MGLGKFWDEFYVTEHGTLRHIKWKGNTEVNARIPYELPFAAKLEVIRFHDKAKMPTRAYANSAAYDLAAFNLTKEGNPKTLTIGPNSTVAVPTGIGLRAPRNHVILVCSRSGLAMQSVFIANGPGVIDPDYTGEIKVLLFNGGIEPCYVKHGDRIAQALVLPFASLPLFEIGSMPDTDRGNRGFGSTGK